MTYGQTRVCAGIVGSCDFQDPELLPLLGAMVKVRNFRGIRATTWGKSRNQILQNEGFARGMKFLEEHDLAFDFQWLGALPTLKAIAEQFPRNRIVMNHLGAILGPVMSAEQVAQWRKDVEEVARCPNVVAKCGGIQMKFSEWPFRFGEGREKPIGSKELCDQILPYYSHVIDCFGPQRCMFESNFPVDRNSCSHRVLFNAFKRIAAAKGLAAAEKKAIFHDTAVRTYRLDDQFVAKL